MLIILWVNFILTRWASKKTLRHDWISFTSFHLLLLNLWLSVTIGHVQSHDLLCLNSISFPPWLDIIIFSLKSWLNWVWFLIPCCFRLFWLWCSSLRLPHGRWLKTLPFTFQMIWLVRPIPHAKYTRALYPYINVGFY